MVVHYKKFANFKLYRNQKLKLDYCKHSNNTSTVIL